MMDRRKFIKTGIGAGAYLSAAALPFDLLAFAKDETTIITILHTNDMHSRIEPFAADDKNYARKGGMAARATLISKIRQEQPNVVLLDAGDVFQGTPYFNFYGGELEYKLMSEMGYDATTLGNHDFDGGIDGLLKQFPFKNFPVLNCNYDFTETTLNSRIDAHTIIDKGGKRIGIFGIGIELSGLVPDHLFGKVTYHDPITLANERGAKLKDMGCDIIICLSHLGWKYDNAKVSDIVLAEQSKNIDLIIGGHTHTFFSQPYEYRNLDGLPVIVNQVGWAGLMLGRIDFIFSKTSEEKIWRSSAHWVDA